MHHEAGPLDPMAIALALTAQADALPPDPHRAVTAAELTLRREAHLQLCMTPEFRQYRQRQHARHPDADLREEWQRPSGELVHKLAAQRKPARRVHRLCGSVFRRVYNPLLALAVAGSLAACGGGGGGSGGGAFMPIGAPVAAAAPAPAPVADCAIYLAGDSILAGVNMSGTLERRPADVLRGAGFKVTDAAVPGASATGSISAFENTQLTARFVVVEWFTNDVNNGLPVIPPLTRAVQHVKASARTPVMTGAYRYAGTDQQRAEVRALATSTGTAYAGWDEVEGERVSATDAHPAQSYSDALAGRLVDTLRALAPECK